MTSTANRYIGVRLTSRTIGTKVTQSKPVRIAINGFGRIGRTIARQVMATARSGGFDLVLINDIASLENCAYLFKYD